MSDPRPDPRPVPERLPIGGVPAGLTAQPLTRADGEVARTRHGNVKMTGTVLVAEQPDLAHTDPGSAPVGVTDAEWRWALRASRRSWSTITARLGDRAWPVAVTLARTGVITLPCRVTDLRLGNPLRWNLTDRWTAHRTTEAETRTAQTSRWAARARAAADTVEEFDPDLAAALRAARGHEPLLPVLIYAAEDLAAGRSHDGPRAFSQTHFFDTKVRDDAPDILTAAGASDETLAALGLRRSPYLGLGGPILLPVGGAVVDLATVHGPVQFRADQPMPADLAPGVTVLAIIENLQAAEAICDNHPTVAVLWSAGQPSGHALRTATRLADQAASVVIATDADLGGVRIAARIYDALADTSTARIIDPGTQPHPDREPFGPVSTLGLQTYTGRSDVIGDFARAVAARNYPVEQEAAIRAALVTDIAE